MAKTKPKPKEKVEPFEANGHSDKCMANIEAPMHTCESGYASTTVQVGSLLPAQAAALKRLCCSLATDGRRVAHPSARHEIGRVVDTPAEAVRWVLDRLAEQYQEKTGKDIGEGVI